MKNIYCIVGPSGSGKTTIAEALQREYGWVTIESYTTRPPRYEGETGHVFVSEEEFRALGEMCAYTKFDGYEYGVTPDIVEKSDLYVIDPAGLELFKERYQGEKGIQVIGLTVPVEELRRRMKLRGDSEEKINRRLANDAVAFRGLGQISDVYIDASGPVGPICDFIHEFVGVKERQAAAMHEFSLRDAEGNIIPFGKVGNRFYDMEDALETLQEVYPDGLPAGWYVVDETEAAGRQAVDEVLDDATERSEMFEKLRDIAREEFGCEIVPSGQKSSFEEVFGSSVKDLGI